MIPFPDPVMLQVLEELPELVFLLGGRVYPQLPDDIKFPALRVNKIMDRERPSHWEATPVYQVEVWAHDEIQAGDMAWTLKNAWPTVVKQTIGDALITARWVDSDPIALPDPEHESVYRFIINLGIRISGVPVV